MKSFSIIFFLFILCFGFVCASCNEKSTNEDTGNKINSIDKAIELTKTTWNKYHIVYALKDAIKPHTTLTLDKYTGETFTTPDQECWIVFIYHVDINTMHTYTWLVINRKTGRIIETAASIPPAIDSELAYAEQQKSWITIKDTWTGKIEQVSPSKVNYQQRINPSFKKK